MYVIIFWCITLHSAVFVFRGSLGENNTVVVELSVFESDGALPCHGVILIGLEDCCCCT